MTTAVYLRISEDRMGLELGVDRQRGDCWALAQRRGFDGVVEYFDNDISATTGKHRPGYRDLMAAIERGEVDRVVVWHQSRLWRNRTERAKGIDLMKAHKVSLIACKGPELDLSTAYGRGMAGILGEFDTWESDVKSERAAAWARQRAESGRPLGSVRLYGYSMDRTEIIAAEAEHVRRWFADIMAGRSLRALAIEAGVTPTTLRQRLTNPAYAGVSLYKGQEHPGRWQPIVPRATLDAAVAILSQPGRTAHGGNVKRAYLGSGLYLCGRCGRSVYSGTHTRRGYKVPRAPIYRCTPDMGGCGRYWRRPIVDAYVEAAVVERLGRDDLSDLLPADRPDLDALTDEATALRARLAKLGTDYVLMGLPEAAVAEAAKTAKARLAEIERHVTAGMRSGALGSILGHPGGPVAAWRAIPAGQVDRRQAVVRSLMTVRLGEVPRGRTPGDLTEEQVIVWYGSACVHIGAPS